MADTKSLIAGVILTSAPARPEASYEGRPVVETVLSVAASWPLAEPLVVVFGKDNQRLIDTVNLQGAVAVVDEDGSSRSSALSVGLDAVVHLLPDGEAALIIDCDVPRIPEATVPALIEELATSGKMAATPQYRYLRGGPVLVERQLWDRLMASDSDQRLEDLLAAHPEWSTAVVISESAPEAVS